jgi:hypothetical protein
MSGTNGQRPLFSNAPVMPAGQMIPTVQPGSNLARAMMGGNGDFNLTPWGGGAGGIPLASMMALAKANQQQNPAGSPNANLPYYAPNATNPTPGNNPSALTQQPDGTWAGTPGSYPPQQAPMQALAPGMMGAGTVGTPSLGSVGMPSGPAPGTPSLGAVGTPSAGQPGVMGQTMNWLQNLYGGQSGGGSGNVGGGG